MRRSAGWMTVWDDRLLEYAAENESVSAAAVKDLDVFRVSRSTISRRLKKLANHRLLLDLGNGVYVITDEGEAYPERGVGCRQT